METDEVFLPVSGYEERYEVSNTGKVRSLDRVSKHNGHGTPCAIKGKILSLELTNRGYYRIRLQKNGEIKRFQVHRLVGMTFIPNPENKPQINHIDGNTKNNNVSNLEWTTQSENIKHAYNIGRKHVPVFERKKGSDNWQSVGIVQLDINGNIINKFGSLLEAQRATGVWQSNITKCLYGIYKTSGGFVWKRDKSR